MEKAHIRFETTLLSKHPSIRLPYRELPNKFTFFNFWEIILLSAIGACYFTAIFIVLEILAHA